MPFLPGGALFFQEFPGDAGTFGGGDGKALPFFASVFPVFVKESLFAVGGTEEPQCSTGHSEHGTQGFVYVFVDARGFVDYQQGHGGKAADGPFFAGQANDARTVREKEACGVLPVAAGADVQLANQFGSLANELGTLALRGTGDDDQGLSHRVGMVEGLDGGDG